MCILVLQKYSSEAFEKVQPTDSFCIFLFYFVKMHVQHLNVRMYIYFITVIIF